MTDGGVANSPLLIGFHNLVTLGLSLHCKLRLVLKLSFMYLSQGLTWPNSSSRLLCLSDNWKLQWIYTRVLRVYSRFGSEVDVSFRRLEEVAHVRCFLQRLGQANHTLKKECTDMFNLSASTSRLIRKVIPSKILSNLVNLELIGRLTHQR